MKSIRIIITTILLLVVSLKGYSQRELTDANRLYESYSYFLAIEKYKEALDKKITLEATMRVADCYRLIENTIKAEEWYKKTMEFKSYPTDVIYFYAQALRENGKYRLAQKQFEEYRRKAESQDQKEAADKFIESCRVAIEYIENPEEYRIINVSDLNSPNSDFSPTLYQGGVVFASDRVNPLMGEAIYGWTGEPYIKIYYSKPFDKNYPEGKWSTPQLFSSVFNENYHDGPAVFNKKENVIFFNRTSDLNLYKLNKSQRKSLDLSENDKIYGYTNKVQIFSSTKSDTGWNKPIPFKYNSLKYSLRHPALDETNTKLFFASDMAGGYGGYDLYYCDLLTDGSWGLPINCGPAINTVQNEGFPHVGIDGVLYFSSEGHIGMGGLDIYSSKLVDGQWSEVENLKYPLNSPKDDFGISFSQDKRSGYLSSTRTQGRGKDDIYYFSMDQRAKPQPVNILICVKTREKIPGSNQTANLDSVLLEVSDGIADTTIKIAISDYYGETCLKGKQGIDYYVKGSKLGYYSKKGSVSTIGLTKSDTLWVDLLFDKIVEEKIPVEKPKEKPKVTPNPPMITLCIKTIEKLNDAGTRTANLDSVLLDIKDGDINKTIKLALTDIYGESCMTVDAGINIKIKGTKDGYFTKRGEISTVGLTKSDTLWVDLIFEKIVENKFIVIDNIYYDFDKSFIRKDAAIELDKIVALLLDNPTINIEMGSHTDARGSDEYNQKLSHRRAKEAVAYLISKGITPSRLTAKGYGETRITNRCKNGVTCEDEDHERNRRTTFRVIGFIKGTEIINNGDRS